MMSAFQPIATEQRTQFYVGLVPQPDSCSTANRRSLVTSSARASSGELSLPNIHGDVGPSAARAALFILPRRPLRRCCSFVDPGSLTRLVFGRAEMSDGGRHPANIS